MKLNKDKNGELLFPASIIDGTMLTLSEIAQGKPAAFAVFLLQEAYNLLCISVQTETEEEFKKEVDKLWEHFQTKAPGNN